MRARQVRAPDGRPWSVRVVWMPRHHAWLGGWRRRDRDLSTGVEDLIDAPSTGSGSGGGFDWGDDLLVGLAVAVAVVVFAGFFWWLLLPVLLLVLDLAVVLILLGAGVLTRVVLRRPWTIEARSGDAVYETTVVGWRAALRERDATADRLQRQPV